MLIKLNLNVMLAATNWRNLVSCVLPYINNSSFYSGFQVYSSNWSRVQLMATGTTYFSRTPNQTIATSVGCVLSSRTATKALPKSSQEPVNSVTFLIQVQSLLKTRSSSHETSSLSTSLPRCARHGAESFLDCLTQ